MNTITCKITTVFELSKIHVVTDKGKLALYANGTTCTKEKYSPPVEICGEYFHLQSSVGLKVVIASELNLTVGSTLIIDFNSDTPTVRTVEPSKSSANKGENMHPNAYENVKEEIAELNTYELIKAGIDELNVCTTYLEAMQALLKLMPYASDTFLGEVVAKDFSDYEDGSLGQTLADAYGGNKTLRKFMRSVAKAILMDRR